MFDISSYLKTNLLAIIALLISLSSLAISLRNLWKERINLKISNDPSESFCFGFIYYDKYKLLFTKLDIINLSKTDTSINRIILIDNGKEIDASPYNIGDTHNENGITLYNTENPSRGVIYNLKSENLLNNLRISSNGHISGYVTFFDVNLISSEKEYTLIVKTPNKDFSTKIKCSPLPGNLKPKHEYS
ncbi:MAG: hypothetical protein RR912_04360 [Clostridium sp.]